MSSTTPKVRTVIGKSEIYRGLLVAFWCDHLKKPNVASLAERKARAKTYISVTMDDKKAFRAYLLRHKVHEILDLRYTPKKSHNDVSLDLENEESWRELTPGMDKALQSIAVAGGHAAGSEGASMSSKEKLKSASRNWSDDDEAEASIGTAIHRLETVNIPDTPDYDPLQAFKNDSMSTFTSQSVSGSKRHRKDPPSIYRSDNHAGLSFNEDESLFSIERVKVGRDDATQFYNSPFIHYWNVQRVIFIDHASKEVMICTPMRAAAYYYKRHLIAIPPQADGQGQPSLGQENAYLLDIDTVNDIPRESLNKAFDQLNIHLQGTLKWDSVYKFLEIKEHEAEEPFYIGGFPDNGGWGKFLFDMIGTIAKKKWVAIMSGTIRSPNHPKVKQRKPEDTYDLLFDDIDAELLLGEPRNFGMIEELGGLQFRGGFAVVEDGNRDHLVIPSASHEGYFNRKIRDLREDKTWCLKASEASNQMPGIDQALHDIS